MNKSTLENFQIGDDELRALIRDRYGINPLKASFTLTASCTLQFTTAPTIERIETLVQQEPHSK